MAYFLEGQYHLMKNLFLTIFCLLSFFSLLAVEVPALSIVVKAFNSGKTTELSKYLDDHVELSLPNCSDNFSRSQATIVLQHFLKSSGAKKFQVQKTTNRGNQNYCIGTLLTREGSYRTIVYTENKKGRSLIKEVRFLPI